MKNSQLIKNVLRNNPEGNQHLLKPRKRRARTTLKRSVLERKFAAMWELLGGPKLEEEHQFHPVRKFRFDFAHIPTKTAIECEGGTRSNGRHNRHDGYRIDCEKYNLAQMAGWRVFRLTGDMIQPGELETLIDYIGRQQT